MQTLKCHKKAARTIEFTITVEAAITKFWFVIKRSLDDLDGDALVSKTVTTVGSGSGQITTAGDSTTPAVANVLISETDLDNLSSNGRYVYAIKALESGGAYAPEDNSGEFVVLPPGVTAVV